MWYNNKKDQIKIYKSQGTFLWNNYGVSIGIRTVFGADYFD